MNLAEAQAALRNAKRVAVLTGAGISAESGIPTFRDAQTGHWARFKPEDLASPPAYQRDPEMVWEWYAGRYRDVLGAQPNDGHRLLAQLEKEKGDGFFLATQNVDGLHARAGSTRLVELHGNLLSARDEKTGEIFPLAAPGKLVTPPTSPNGHRMRPNVVWFGEYLPEAALQAAQDAFHTCDVALIIGTSGVVYPAAGLALEAMAEGASVIEINPTATELTPLLSYSIRAGAAEGLRQLLTDPGQGG